MCDTLAVKRGGAVWFAKNSDREPTEPQRVEFHPASKGGGKRRCTYIEIDDATERFAVLISRPDWMWGAEMGVNEAGVAIGNEAVFSRRIMKRGEALLGMDLVRLGLERAASATAAVDTITALLERHGQGGPAGYTNKGLRYDNSFLIADGCEIFVLETAGRCWVSKKVETRWAISNGYTLGADYDRASQDFAGGDFRAANATWLMPRLACASARAAANIAGLEARGAAPMSLSALARLMRGHARGDGFAGGGNGDVCMHAGGALRPSATTGSMIVRLAPGETPRAAFTGAPNPCVALYRPATFTPSVAAIFTPALWERGAALSARAARDPVFRANLRAAIAAQEPAILEAVETGDCDRAETLACQWGSTKPIEMETA